jgi:hypothetical protein
LFSEPVDSLWGSYVCEPTYPIGVYKWSSGRLESPRMSAQGESNVRIELVITLQSFYSPPVRFRDY